MPRLALIGLILAAGLAAAIYVVYDSREPDEQVIAAPTPAGQDKPVTAANQLIPKPTLSLGGGGTGGAAFRDTAAMVPGVVTIGADTVQESVISMIPDGMVIGGGTTHDAFAETPRIDLATGGDIGGDAMSGGVVLADRPVAEIHPATRPRSNVNDGTGGAAHHPGA